MATSGKLAEDLSGALEIPPASVRTLLQVLRQAELVSSKGRGPSAAEMSREDATALLIALASHASAPFLSEITDRLMKMRFRASQVLPDGAADTNSRWSVRDGEDDECFSSALADLMQGAVKSAPDPQVVDPLAAPGKVGVWIGVDGRRSGGFALIRKLGSDAMSTRNLYSTWKVIPAALNGPLDVLNFFESGPRFFSITYYGGEVIARVVESLREPVGRPRKRGGRVARSSRGV